MSTRMAEAGFIRTPEQIRIKWKNIRQAYNNAKQNNSSGQERVSCPFYSILDDLLGKRNLSNSAGQQGLDVGFEAANQGESLQLSCPITLGQLLQPCPKDLEETMGSTTQQREDDSPSTSTESTRRIPPLQKNSELPGKSCNILAAPTNATFCCNIYPHQDM
uniref:Myb/SANT-like DNA-binding domain-containing protein n=1 Tax=Gadus morhua TaxID=8049 RepID=A0A8C5CVR8_GADMO